MSRFNVIIDRIAQWGKSSDKVSAVLIIGSQAREDHQADENSDLDRIMFVDEPDYFLLSDGWLANIGNFHVSFIEITLGGRKEKRVLFGGVLDVDFTMLPKDAAHALAGSDETTILERGYRILTDKIGLEQTLPDAHKTNQLYSLLSERDF